jgi:hypothetical protein
VDVFRAVLYVVSVVSSGACAVLLFRAYRCRPVRLLMWSGVCFAALTLNAIGVFVDLVVFPQIDLRLVRQIPAAIGLMCLLYGHLCDAD